MLDIYLDNIPYDLLNIIFHFIKPSVKYKLNKKYFFKYYSFRFNYINNSISYLKHIKIRDIFIIKNYNYIKFLIKNDFIMILQFIINNKYNNDKTFYIIKKSIIFENNKYKNFIDLCKHFSDKFKSYYVSKFINLFIINNNVSITNNHILLYNKYDIHNYKKKQNYKNKNNKWIV